MGWLRRGRPDLGKVKCGKTAEQQLGAEVIVRVYKGCPHEMVIRKTRMSAHLSHLRIERPDLHPFVVQKSFNAHFTGNRGPYAVYEAEHKEILIYDDWQLAPELKYGFTSNPRWDDPPKLDKAKLSRAIEQNEWIFAKTMAYNPHWYALRRKWDSTEMVFDEFVHMIRGHGYTQRYQTQKYKCLNVGKHFYWSMGAPFLITTLVNRKVIGT